MWWSSFCHRKTLRSRTYYLVRWQGHDSAEDSWEPAEHLATVRSGSRSTRRLRLAVPRPRGRRPPKLRTPLTPDRPDRRRFRGRPRPR
jgi:hypothetical protein